MQWCAFVLFIFMCMGVVPACMAVNHAHSVSLEGHQRTWDSLELELHMVVNHYAVAGNRSWVLQKSSQCLITEPFLQLEWCTYVIPALLLGDGRQRWENHPSWLLRKLAWISPKSWNARLWFHKVEGENQPLEVAVWLPYLDVAFMATPWKEPLVIDGGCVL